MELLGNVTKLASPSCIITSIKYQDKFLFKFSRVGNSSVGQLRVKKSYGKGVVAKKKISLGGAS